MNKRIYLAGHVTGRKYKSVHAEFASAKQFLLSQGFDEVINPCELVAPGTNWTDAMLILIPYLTTVFSTGKHECVFHVAESIQQ